MPHRDAVRANRPVVSGVAGTGAKFGVTPVHRAAGGGAGGGGYLLQVVEAVLQQVPDEVREVLQEFTEGLGVQLEVNARQRVAVVGAGAPKGKGSVLL